MEPVADETRTLRRAMRDLVALSALPAVWAGYRPLQVAEGLADVLLSTLRLDLVYLRLPGPTDGQGIEVARTAGGPASADRARDIGRAVAPWLEGAGIDAATPLPNPVGPGTVRVAVVPIGCGPQDGVLVAASGRTAFPGEEDGLILSVAANQAAVVLQRERDEEALRESEERYRSVITAMREGVVLLGADGRIRACNASAERILGLSAEGIRGRTTFDPRWQAIHEDGSAFPGEAHPVTVTLRTGRPCSNVVMGVRKPSGELTWISINSQPLLRGNEPTPYAVVASFSDVSERKKTEEALRDSEHRWRSLTEALPQLVWTARPDGFMDYGSAQIVQYMGRPESELLGWGWLEMLHPEDRERTRQAWRAAVEGGQSEYEIEHRFRRSDGTYRWFKTRALAIRDGESNISKWFGTSTDITTDKQLEEELRQANERLDLAVRGSNIAIWDVDMPEGDFRRGRRDYVNTWEQLGYERGEVPPDHPPMSDARTHPDDRAAAQEAIRRYLAGEADKFELETRLRHKDGSYRWVLVRGVAVRDAGGRPIRFVGSGVDITDRKRLEEELRQAKEAAESANRAKDEFLANVSHEIRTPFGAILGMTELVLDTPLTEDQRECLKTAKSAADNLLGIINDLLDVAKIEAGKLELDCADFSLRAVVGDTLRALAARAHQRGLELIYEVRPDVPDALAGDAGRLRQVLLNLVGNAIKFTDQGEVEVRVCVDRETRGPGDKEAGSEEGTMAGENGLQTPATHGGAEKPRPGPPGLPVSRSPCPPVSLSFEVRDTGIGIPPDQQARIFGAFEQEDASTTRRYGGTGLGLTIAARLVALMGGKIIVDSAPGRGSTFAFTARFGLQSHPPEHAAARPPALLHGLPVLIVDDNATSRRILGEWLRRWRMEPLAVGDGVAGLAALRDAAACGRPYALVLLDARLPDADGLALAAQVRERAELSATRIILLTSGDRPGDLARFRELWVNAYLLKPVQPDELLETLSRVMGRTDGDALPGSSPAGEGEQTPEPGERALRILVAEDNEFNAQLLEQLLGRRGHRVRLAGNGREALGLAGEEGFDLMLLDMHMPELDGFQVARAVRARERAAGGHLPIVALTARARPEDRAACLAAGMDDFLAKPVQAADLWAAIDRAAAARPAAAPPGPGLLDARVLLAACGGDAGLLAKMCQSFRAGLPGQLKAVQAALRDRDAPGLREAAHKLCGMVAAFSSAAGGVASELEGRAARGRLEEARPLAARLEAMAEELMGRAGGLSLDDLRAQAGTAGR